MSDMEMDSPLPPNSSLAVEKVRGFPHKPGVYLMKDRAGRVIYVGKAKDLRNRAGSYFLKAAAEDARTARLVQEIRDIDYLEADSEVDALLVEARLIKDIQPKYNQDLKDDKTFPYLEIHSDEDFPRVEFTREPSARGRSFTGRSPVLRRCEERSKSCRRYSSFAPARWTLTRTIRGGVGSVPAFSTRSASALPRAISASRRRTIARTFAVCSDFWKARRRNCSRRCGAR